MQKALSGKVVIITDERDHQALNGVNGDHEVDDTIGAKQVEVGQQASHPGMSSEQRLTTRCL